jgi:DNA-binding FadR family transcriptional regulator
MRLDSLSRPRLSARVADAIRREIVRGGLKPGDRLPTEQKLADALGVSRNAVREGLAELRQAGIVTSRQGVGAFVADPQTRPTLELDPAVLAKPRDYRSLFELRRILEVGAAGLAASNRTEEDLALMAEAFEGMKRAGIWSEDGLDQDIAFHRALAGASRNGFLLLFVAFVDDLLKDSIRIARELTPRADLQAVTVAEHAAILDAVAAGDPAAARAATSAHLESAERRLGL